MANTDTMLMRREKAKPRAKPATTMAVIRLKKNGDSQNPVPTTTSTWRATSKSTRSRVRRFMVRAQAAAFAAGDSRSGAAGLSTGGSRRRS